MTNEEIMRMVEEFDLLDDLLSILKENGDSTTNLVNNEHALEIAKDLLEGELTCKNES